jgi:hypothetical protein
MVRIGVFHSERECFQGISASVAPLEDETGDQEAEKKEGSNAFR